MPSCDAIRKELRSAKGPGAARLIHQLGRCLARDRLHLHRTHHLPEPDLLTDGNGQTYKVKTRTVASLDQATAFDIAGSEQFDYLVGVFLLRGKFTELAMIRVPWSGVMWVAKQHGSGLRFRWSRNGPAASVSELL